MRRSRRRAFQAAITITSVLFAASGCSLILGISDLPTTAEDVAEGGGNDSANPGDGNSGSDAFTQGDGRVAICDVPGNCDNAGGVPDTLTTEGLASQDAGDYFTVRYCEPEAGACSYELDLGSATSTVESAANGISNVKTVAPLVVDRISFVYTYISQVQTRFQPFYGYMQSGPCGSPPSTAPMNVTFHAPLFTDAGSVTAGCTGVTTLEIPEAGVGVKIDDDGGAPLVSQLSICIDVDGSYDANGYGVDMATPVARLPLENALLASLEATYQTAVDSQACLAP